ncbi:MAG: nuclease [Actinobacteria bacterium]|nr:nuclease [Actinomycetota bacterium]
MSERFWYGATVLNVIDGDTVDLMIDLGFNIHHKIRVRLYGVNTPESRTSNKEEKVLGLKAKDFTKDWLTSHKWVYINTIPDKNDKYGRILAKIYSSENINDPSTACLNKDIIESGLAREYYGVGDKTWTEFK